MCSEQFLSENTLEAVRESVDCKKKFWGVPLNPHKYDLYILNLEAQFLCNPSSPSIL